MMTSTIRFCTASMLVLALLSTGCAEAEIIDSADLDRVEVNTLPDLAFGGPKGDQPSTNTILGERLEPGRALSGEGAGFIALPFYAETGEPIPIQAWTSKSSVVFVYGPRRAGHWDMEQVRAGSYGVQPDVETRRVEFQTPESGEYLLVVGSLDESSTEWIVARGVLQED